MLKAAYLRRLRPLRPLAFGLLLVSGAVVAQPATPAPPAPVPAAPVPAPPVGAPTTSPGVAAPPAAIDLRVQQRSNLTPKEMTDGATEYRSRISEVRSRINQLLTEARRVKDIIRINCLLDKMVQVRASADNADRSFGIMQEAIARTDQGAALHEFTRITIVNQNVQVLSSEAEACVGEELSYVGATRVDVEAPEAPDPNPGTPTPEDPGRPPSASPYI
jgi:hypothetical protein